MNVYQKPRPIPGHAAIGDVRRSRRAADRMEGRSLPSRRRRVVWRYPPIAPRVHDPNPDHNDLV